MTPCKHCGEIESRHCINWPHPYKLCDLVHGHGYEAARCIQTHNRFGRELRRVCDGDWHGPAIDSHCRENPRRCLHHDPVYETATIETVCTCPADQCVWPSVPGKSSVNCEACGRDLSNAPCRRVAPSVPPEPVKVETCGAVFRGITCNREAWRACHSVAGHSEGYEWTMTTHPFGYRPPPLKVEPAEPCAFPGCGHSRKQHVYPSGMPRTCCPMPHYFAAPPLKPEPKPAFWTIQIGEFMAMSKEEARLLAESYARSHPDSKVHLLSTVEYVKAEPVKPQSVKWHGGGE